ncbi:MAG: flagellar basal body rod protein FlgF [Novosphingobium sp.]
MDRLIWTAVTGMNASMAQQRVIASNMANAQTTGFRAEVMAQTPMTLVGPAVQVRAMSDPAVRGARMDQGAFIATGRPLDIAIEGTALLAVQAPDGAEGYTRRGDLAVSPSGLLVNGEGFAVLGEGGPISVPPGAQVSIAPDGAVLAADPAQPDQPPALLGRVKLASWQGSPIEKGLDGLFRVKGGGVLPSDAEARVIPATLEGSNVRTAEVLVDMIEAQRLFEMRTQLIATARQIDEGGAGLMRLS